MLSRRLKGKWSLRRRQGFHSTLTVSFTLRHHSTSLSNWYNLSLIFTCTNGGESTNEGSQSLRFWRLLPRGGGEKILAQSKRTAPPTSKNFEIMIYLVFTKVCFFQLVSSDKQFHKLVYFQNWHLTYILPIGIY
jgi:hypothetical protein